MCHEAKMVRLFFCPYVYRSEWRGEIIFTNKNFIILGIRGFLVWLFQFIKSNIKIFKILNVESNMADEKCKNQTGSIESLFKGFFRITSFLLQIRCQLLKRSRQQFLCKFIWFIYHFDLTCWISHFVILILDEKPP